ncbi:hypothetical protein PIIN_10860 [Serendipita indica DSM 11827]|uniref:Uncharacterized protein n=1 Tax=Serendipita indica (strain DSM 11827) TaxID=1109443 RepID=G4TZY2_SERID|nr:hypothetical protein PIIN_10860 [Serendipita indica DSM 11827]
MPALRNGQAGLPAIEQAEVFSKGFLIFLLK